MAKAKVTAAHVVDALRADYGLAGSRLEMEEWALLTEVPLRAPGPDRYARDNERTIDVLLLRNWSSGKAGFDRLAVEVKVSKADYRNETDAKREPAWVNAHRCAYACPPGIIDPTDLPDGWGLLWVHPEPIRDVAPTHPSFGRRGVWKRRPTRHEPTADPIRLMHTLARRASRAEERLRRGGDDAAAVAAMREEVKRLHARLANRDQAINRQRDRANTAMQRLRAQGPQVCADCAEPVRADLARRDRTGDGFWAHADSGVGDRCRMARSEAQRLAREADSGSRYSYAYSYAPPVETVTERAEWEAEWQQSQAEDAAHSAMITDGDRAEEYRYSA